jgi:hypothetical protein
MKNITSKETDAWIIVAAIIIGFTSVAIIDICLNQYIPTVQSFGL